MVVTVTSSRKVESWLSKKLSIPDSRCSAACLMATCLLYTACSCFFIHDEGPAGFHALWMLLSHGDRMVNEQTDRNFLMKRMGTFQENGKGTLFTFGDGHNLLKGLLSMAGEGRGWTGEAEELRGSGSHRKKGRVVC